MDAFTLSSAYDFRPLPQVVSPFSKSHLLTAWLRCVNETDFCKGDTVTNGHIYKASGSDSPLHTRDTKDGGSTCTFLLQGRQYELVYPVNRRQTGRINVKRIDRFIDSKNGFGERTNFLSKAHLPSGLSLSPSRETSNTKLIGTPRMIGTTSEVEPGTFPLQDGPSPTGVGKANTQVGHGQTSMPNRKCMQLPGTCPQLGELIRDKSGGWSSGVSHETGGKRSPGGRLQNGLAYRSFHDWSQTHDSHMNENDERSGFRLMTNRKSSAANQREELTLRHTLDGYRTICKQRLSNIRIEQKKLSGNLTDLKNKMATLALEPVPSESIRGAVFRKHRLNKHMHTTQTAGGEKTKRV